MNREIRANSALVFKAAAFAVEKHHGQFRKSVAGAEVPYVTHCFRVAGILVQHGELEWVTIAAAILHDTLEDTKTTFAELCDEFGEEVANTVAEVSDNRSLSKAERRAAQLAKAPYLSRRAKLIKAADKLDNVDSIIKSPPSWSDEVKLGYAETAEGIVTALGTSSSLTASFAAKVAELRAGIA